MRSSKRNIFRKAWALRNDCKGACRTRGR
jgi:hypothetical protein